MKRCQTCGHRFTPHRRRGLLHYIGRRDDGVEMYGGAEDASRFARAALGEQP